MARITRKYISKKSFVFHILNRGNAKQEVFHEAEDFKYFWNLLKKYQIKFGFKLYHWVLMNNHFHLEMELPDSNLLSKIMAGISRAYVHYHHAKYDSAGYLWQGRFKSQPIQKGNYLLQCGRYIERNPLRAGIVDFPWLYQWSSCKFYSSGIEDDITNHNPYFNKFLKNTDQGRIQYRKWILESDNLEFRGATRPVGDEVFLKSLLVRGSRFVAPRRGRKVS